MAGERSPSTPPRGAHPTDSAPAAVPFDPLGVDTPASFSTLLTEARLNAGLSIRDVSRRTGMPVSTLGGYFGGRHLPAPSRPEVLRELLTALSVPAADHDRWQSALRRATSQSRRAAPRTLPSPYPGLRAYESDEGGTFFGRREATRELVDIVHRSHREGGIPIVVVTGASGAGKSSLLKAGLVPALEDWHVAIVEPGVDPVAVLAAAALDPIETTAGSCLIVDQAEGLWTKADAATRTEFLARVATWVRSSGTTDEAAVARPEGRIRPRVAIFNIRSDFYSQAADEDGLRTALQANHFIVAPLTATELAEVIVEPARLAGITARPDLVSTIVHECLATHRGDGSFLPHVAHCLSRMWTRRQGPELTLEMYEQCGGIGGVMRESAEAAWQELEESDRPVARRLLLAMVQAGPGLQRTSRPVPVDGLSPTEHAVIEAFTRARVVAIIGDSASLAHEAIIAAWPRLREWVEDDLDQLTLARRLERDAQAWVDADRDEDLLLRGTRLLAFQELSDQSPGYVGPRESELLAASHQWAIREDAARARRQRKQTTMLVLVSALAVAALVAVVGYVSANHELGRARDAAASRQLAALSAEAGEKNYVAGSSLALAALSTAETVEATSAVLSSTTLGTVTRIVGPVGHRVVTGSNDGRIVAAAGEGPQIVLYDAVDDTVAETTRLAAPVSVDGAGTVFALQLSPDGRYLAAGGTSGLVRVFDLSGSDGPGDPLDLPAGGTVYALAWTGDNTLYAGTQNSGLLRWDAVGDSFAAGRAPSTDHAVLALATDGEWLAAGDEAGGVTLWGLDGSDPGPPARAALSGLGIASLAFGAGELLVGGRDSSVRRLALDDAGADGRDSGARLGPAEELATFGSWVNALMVTGAYQAAGSSDSTVRVWRSEEDTVGSTLRFPAPVTSLQPLAGQRMAVALTNGDVQVVDVSRVLLYPGAGNVFTTAFAMAGDRLLVVPGTVNRLSVFDATIAAKPTLILTIDGDEESGFHGVGAISPDGRLVVAARRDGQVLGFDISDAERPERVFSVKISDEMPEQMAFSPSGDFFVLGSDDHSVYVAPLSEEGTVTDVQELTGPTNYVLGVAVAPDGTQIAAASLDGGVHRWRRDGESWTALDPIEVGSALLTVGFHPSGEQLAAAGSEGVVRVWDITGTDPQPIAELTGPDNEVYQLAFAPDGHLAAASLDETLTIWALVEGHDGIREYEKHAVLRPESGALYTVGWAPDGEHLVAGGVSGAVHLWDTDPESVREQTCDLGGDLLSREEWDRLVGGLTYEPVCG